MPNKTLNFNFDGTEHFAVSDKLLCVIIDRWNNLWCFVINNTQYTNKIKTSWTIKTNSKDLKCLIGLLFTKPHSEFQN